MPRIWSTSRGGWFAVVAAGVVMLGPKAARAHFKLDAPACYTSQDVQGFPQKGGPCGMPDSPAGTLSMAVTSFQPGETIQVKVNPTIPHPGWYRIALLKGKSSAQTKTTLPEPPGTTCVPAKVMNPVWSPTQPILYDGLPSLAVAQTFPVKLPDGANCTTAEPCTLQVLMVMSDHTYPSCYYHHCADITIGAGDGGAPRDAGAGDGSVRSDSSDGSNVTGAGGSAAGAGGAAAGGAGGAGGTQVVGSGGSTGGDGGSTNATGGSSSTTLGATTGGTTTSGTASGATGSGGASTSSATSGLSPASDPNGCTCSVPGRGGLAAPSVGAGLALGIALGWRRRKKQRR